jgi:hypothetical protein
MPTNERVVAMTTKIDWDESAAESESASVGQKLLNQLVPSYNKLVDVVERYRAATDVDEAVAQAVENSTDEEVVKLREQIEKAKRLIEHNQAAIDERVRQQVIESIDPEFDEDKYRAEYNDLRASIKTDGDNIRGTFKILGYVSAEQSPAGRLSNWKGENEFGNILLQVLDIPKLDATTGGSTSTTDPAVKEFNKAAKEWARSQGMKVADKGALSTEVKEAYTKATGVEPPK